MMIIIITIKTTATTIVMTMIFPQKTALAWSGESKPPAGTPGAATPGAGGGTQVIMMIVVIVMIVVIGINVDIIVEAIR